MNRLLLILLFLFTTKVNAQITFQKIYLDAQSIPPSASCIAPNGHMAIASVKSYLTPITAIGSIFFKVLDSLGNTMLFKSYDTLYNNVQPSSIIPTSDNGYTIVGSTTNYDTSSNGTDGFLIKIDDTGKVLWGENYGGKGTERANDAQQTKDGGYIILASRSTLGMYIIKTDSTGNIIWTKTYGDTVSNLPFGRFIRQTNDGGYVIAGEAPTGTLPNDFCLMKIDSLGNYLWGKAYGGIYPEKLFAFDTISDGEFIMGGYSYSFNSNHNTKDAYLIKTDNQGNVIWANTYSKPIYYGSSINYVSQTKDGGFITSVNTDTFGVDYDIVLLKINNAGNTEWAKKIGQPNVNEGGSIAGQTKDGGFMISGTLGSFSIPGTFNFSYLVKTDSLGNSGCYTDTFTFAINNAPPTVTPINFTIFSTLDSSALLTSTTTIYHGTDSILCYNDGSNAIHEVPSVANEISVYPNPSTGIICIKSPTKMEAIEIINSLGVKVYNSSLYTTHTTINLSKEAKGIYWYRIQTATKTVSGKLLLE